MHAQQFQLVKIEILRRFRHVIVVIFEEELSLLLVFLADMLPVIERRRLPNGPLVIFS